MEKLIAYKRIACGITDQPGGSSQQHMGRQEKLLSWRGHSSLLNWLKMVRVLAEHLFEARADNPMAQPNLAPGTTDVGR